MPAERCLPRSRSRCSQGGAWGAHSRAGTARARLPAGPRCPAAPPAAPVAPARRELPCLAPPCPPQVLHVGDRFSDTGNDSATRDCCSILWVANPEETGEGAAQLAQLAGLPAPWLAPVCCPACRPLQLWPLEYKRAPGIAGMRRCGFMQQLLPAYKQPVRRPTPPCSPTPRRRLLHQAAAGRHPREEPHATVHRVNPRQMNRRVPTGHLLPAAWAHSGQSRHRCPGSGHVQGCTAKLLPRLLSSASTHCWARLAAPRHPLPSRQRPTQLNTLPKCTRHISDGQRAPRVPGGAAPQQQHPLAACVCAAGGGLHGGPCWPLAVVMPVRAAPCGCSPPAWPPHVCPLRPPPVLSLQPADICDLLLPRSYQGAPHLPRLLFLYSYCDAALSCQHILTCRYVSLSSTGNRKAMGSSAQRRAEHKARAGGKGWWQGKAQVVLVDLDAAALCTQGNPSEAGQARSCKAHAARQHRRHAERQPGHKRRIAVASRCRPCPPVAQLGSCGWPAGVLV